MKKIDYLAYSLILLVMIVGIKMVVDSDFFQLRCIYSDVDGQKYCVRERTKLKLAANKLAEVRSNLDKLVAKCKETKSDLPQIKRLLKNYNPKKICETLPTSEYTAYSENKGEKLAFCLDTEKNNQGKLIDLNTLTFVAIHEIAHVATKSIEHTKEFWDNFKLLLEVAAEEGIYTPIDYSENPQRYCGMQITDNPYYNE